jgi:hypothetical protein
MKGNIMDIKDIFRRSLDGEFGEDVKINNVIRLIPMAESEAAEAEKCIKDNADYFNAHPKDQDLVDFQNDAKEWRALAAEGRAFLKTKGLRAHDEMPKHIWCGQCGKTLKNGFRCPDGHQVKDMKGRIIHEGR